MITITDLIKKVRYLINETENDAGVSLITDDLRSIDDTIAELMPQAVAIVQKQRNGRYVNVKTFSPTDMNVSVSTDGFMTVTLPNDFADLVSVKLDSWRTSCVGISSSESAELLYRLNKNSLPLSFRSVCFWEVTAEGTKVLKLFPSSGSDTLNHFVYEAEFNATEGLNRCDESMADAVSYVCAALLYNVFERYDAAKSFMSFALALCGENGK